MKRHSLLFTVCILSFLAYGQSPLSGNYRIERNAASMDSMVEKIDEIIHLVEFLAEDQVNYEMLLDRHPDIGRTQLSKLLKRFTSIQKDGEFAIELTVEELKDSLIADFQRVEDLRISIEKVFDWAQFPDIIARTIETQTELKWRTIKALKQMKVLAENYSILQYRQDDINSLKVELEKRWKDYVEDSSSFQMLYDALQETENAHLRPLKKLIDEVKLQPLNAELAKKFSSFVNNYYKEAFSYVLNATDDYLAEVVTRFDIKVQDIQRVQAYWKDLYAETQIDATRIKHFIDTSYEELRKIEEGYLDLCRNFDLVEVDEFGKSLLTIEHIEALAQIIASKIEEATWAAFDGIQYNEAFNVVAESILSTDYRKFKFYKDYLVELSKRDKVLADDIFAFIEIDTTVFGEDFDYSAFKNELKELKEQVEFVKHAINDPIKTFSTPLLDAIGFTTNAVERRNGSYYLTFEPTYLFGENSWLSMEDTSAITIDITDPSDWEAGMEQCTNELKQRLLSRGIVIKSKDVLRGLMLSNLPDFLLPEIIYYKEGQELTMRFSSNAPISCATFSNSPVGGCNYQLPYDALNSDKVLFASLYELFKKEIIAKYEQPLKEKIQRLLADSGISQTVIDVQNWLIANNVQIGSNGIIIRVPINSIAPQVASGSVVFLVKPDGSLSQTIEDFNLGNALITILNENPFIHTMKENDHYQIYLKHEGTNQKIGTYIPATGTFETSGTPVRLSLTSGYTVHAQKVILTGNRFVLENLEIDILGENIKLSSAELLWKNNALSVRIPKQAIDDAADVVIDKIKAKAEGELMELVLSNAGLMSLVEGGTSAIVTVQDYIDGVTQKVEMTKEELIQKLKEITKDYSGFENIQFYLNESPKRATFDATYTLAGETIFVKNMGVVFHNSTSFELDYSKVNLESSLITKLEEYLQTVVPKNDYLSFDKSKFFATPKAIRGEVSIRLNMSEFGISHVFNTYLSINENGVRFEMDDQNFWEIAGKQIVSTINQSLAGQEFGNVTVKDVNWEQKGTADYLVLRASVNVYEGLEVPGSLFIPLDNDGTYKLEVEDFMTGINGLLKDKLSAEFEFGDNFKLNVYDPEPIDQHGNPWDNNSTSFPKGIAGKVELIVASVSIPLPNFVVNKDGLRFTNMDVIRLNWPAPLLFPPYVKLTRLGMDLDLKKKTLTFRGDASFIAAGSEFLAKIHGDFILDLAKFDSIKANSTMIVLTVIETARNERAISIKDASYEESLKVKGLADDIIMLDANGEIKLKTGKAVFNGLLTLFGQAVADANIDINFKDISFDATTKVSFLDAIEVKAKAHADEGFSNVNLAANIDFDVGSIEVGSAGLSVSESEAYIEFEAIGIDFAIGASGINDLENAVEEALNRLLQLNIGDVEEMLKQILKGNLRVNPFSDFGGGKSFGSSSGKGGSKGGSSKGGGKGGRESRGSRGSENGNQAGTGEHKGRYTGAGTKIVGEGNPIGGTKNSEWNENPGGGFNPINPGSIPNVSGTSLLVEDLGGCFRLYTNTNGTLSTLAHVPRSYDGFTFINTNGSVNSRFINTYGGAMVFFSDSKLYCFIGRMDESCSQTTPVVIPIAVIKYDNANDLMAGAANFQSDAYNNDRLKFSLLTNLIYGDYSSNTKVYFYPNLGYAYNLNNSDYFELIYLKNGEIMSKRVFAKNLKESQLESLIKKRMN